MTWGKVDDDLYDHPKLDALGKDRLPAMGLWVLALSWSGRYLTDGMVPSHKVIALGGTVRLANLLVDVGLWERTVNGYRFHDFLKFNASAEAVHERRMNMRELGKRGGIAASEARRLKREDDRGA